MRNSVHFLTPPAWCATGEQVDGGLMLVDTLRVPFNSGAGIGVPNPVTDSRPYSDGQPPICGIFCVRLQHHWCVSSMAGRGGRAARLAGIHWAGTPIPPCACHPRLASGGRS